MSRIKSKSRKATVLILVSPLLVLFAVHVAKRFQGEDKPYGLPIAASRQTIEGILKDNHWQHEWESTREFGDSPWMTESKLKVDQLSGLLFVQLPPDNSVLGRLSPFPKYRRMLYLPFDKQQNLVQVIRIDYPDGLS